MKLFINKNAFENLGGRPGEDELTEWPLRSHTVWLHFRELMSFLFVKLTFQMSIVHRQQHSFSTHERMLLRKCFRQKMLRPEGDSNHQPYVWLHFKGLKLDKHWSCLVAPKGSFDFFSSLCIPENSIFRCPTYANEGAHTVVFVYVPGTFLNGYYITCMGPGRSIHGHLSKVSLINVSRVLRTCFI